MLFAVPVRVTDFLLAARSDGRKSHPKQSKFGMKFPATPCRISVVAFPCALLETSSLNACPGVEHVCVCEHCMLHWKRGGWLQRCFQMFSVYYKLCPHPNQFNADAFQKSWTFTLFWDGEMAASGQWLIAANGQWLMWFPTITSDLSNYYTSQSYDYTPVSLQEKNCKLAWSVFFWYFWIKLYKLWRGSAKKWWGN